MSASEPRFYVTGGTLKPGSASYVERPADGELLRKLRAGDYCYVLTSRQMGKSSLMARCARRLGGEGVRTAVVDITQIGSKSEGLSAERWYYGVVYTVHRELGLSTPLKAWWQELAGLLPEQRFVEYFRDLALTADSEPVVVFFDEIDSLIGQPFAADFFAAVRSCYNARGREEVFERLTFALLGVATPDQLIHDTRRTPFNVGHRVEVTDFTAEQARPLGEGLATDEDRRRHLLERILWWTDGHPYLTQLLCRHVAEAEREAEGPIEAPAQVDRVVETLLLAERALREESNLKYTAARLTAGGRGARPRLRLYLRILRRQQPTGDSMARELAELKLSGVVKLSDRGDLQIRNRLYERLFTAAWVRRQMPRDLGWQAAAATVALASLVGFGWYVVEVPKPYVQQIEAASEDYPAAAYDELIAHPFFPRRRADELLAKYWDRRARRAAGEERRDESLLSWLQAVRASDSERRRSEAALLVGMDYPRLRWTARKTNIFDVVVFRPDSRFFVAIEGDKAWLWDSESGTRLSRFPLGHEGNVLNAVWSPDGKALMTVAEGRIFFWRFDDGVGDSPPTPTTSRARYEEVTALAWGPRGPFVLVPDSPQQTARWRHAETGEPFGRPVPISGRWFDLAWTPDGTPVWIWSDFSTLRGEEKLWVQYGELGELTEIDFPRRTESWLSPDGRRLLTVSENLETRLWDTETGAPVGRPVYLAAFDAHLHIDGETVVLSGYNDAQVVDSSQGHLLGSPVIHEDLYPFYDSKPLRPDGRGFLTLGNDGSLRFWEIDREPWLPAWQHEGPIHETLVHPSAAKALTFGWDGVARLWDLDSGDAIGTAIEHRKEWLAVDQDHHLLFVGEEPQPPTDEIVARFPAVKLMMTASFPARFSPDGRRLVTNSLTTARVWDTATAQLIGKPMHHYGRIDTVAFSADGEKLAVGLSNGQIHRWRVDSGEQEGTALLTQPMAEPDLAFSPRGDMLSIEIPWGRFMLLDIRSSEPRLLWSTDLSAIGFHPEGEIVCLGFVDGTARLWDSRSAEFVGPTVQHEDAVETAVFSPNGDKILTSTSDQIRLWWADSGELIGGPWQAEYPDPGFSSDGELALSCGASDFCVDARVWDAATGHSIEWDDSYSSATVLAFSPDGQTVVVRTGFRWLSRYRRDGDRLELAASRLSAFQITENVRCLDPGCERLQVVVAPSEASREAVVIDFGQPRRPLEGDAETLLETWQERLGLRFNSRWEIVPR